MNNSTIQCFDESELVLLFGRWIDLSDSSNCLALVERYRKLNVLIEVNPNNTEVYRVRAEFLRVIFLAYTKYKHLCLEQFISDRLEEI